MTRVGPESLVGMDPVHFDLESKEVCSRSGRQRWCARLGASCQCGWAEASKSGFCVCRSIVHGSCGYAGNEFARTPNMDKLAADGCNFHQAISATPVCAPHRCSLMTGKYQSSTGMVINELRMSPDHQCFGQSLTKSGYRTGYIGKWHMWANQLGQHDLIKNGFVPPGPYRLGFDGFWAAYNFNHVYHRAPYFPDDPTPHIRDGYEPNGQTDMAIRFLKDTKQSADPFALFLSWGPPHLPWTWDNVDSEHAELYRHANLPQAPNFSNVSDPDGDDWQKLPPNYEQVAVDRSGFTTRRSPIWIGTWGC